MEKESLYERQKIDCNCNDCAFLIRDNAKLNQVTAEDKANQLWFFGLVKQRAVENANERIERGDTKRGEAALKEANKLKHTYIPQRSPIMYGTCSKYSKEISFIPTMLQLDTQKCFVHRKDAK